ASGAATIPQRINYMLCIRIPVAFAHDFIGLGLGLHRRIAVAATIFRLAVHDAVAALPVRIIDTGAIPALAFVYQVIRSPGALKECFAHRLYGRYYLRRYRRAELVGKIR